MDATAKPRLHPLLTAAAISVTVFSAVGVGALTGLIPTSHSTTKESAPLVAEAPATQSAPQAAPSAEPAMPAAPAASPAPAPKPVKKHVVHKASAPVHVAAAPEAMPADMPPPPPVQVQAPLQAQAPVIDPSLGVVQSVREVTHEPKSNGAGPIIGGIAGAVLGNQVGHGAGRSIATVLGAAGGAFAGKEVEVRERTTKSWEITVRLDDGSLKTIPSATAPIWHGGERVRLVEGQLRPA